jgi:hypothetical protein
MIYRPREYERAIKVWGSPFYIRSMVSSLRCSPELPVDLPVAPSLTFGAQSWLWLDAKSSELYQKQPVSAFLLYRSPQRSH